MIPPTLLPLRSYFVLKLVGALQILSCSCLCNRTASRQQLPMVINTIRQTRTFAFPAKINITLPLKSVMKFPSEQTTPNYFHQHKLHHTPLNIMDSSSPSAGFVSFDDTVLCAWYTQDGHMRIRTSLIVAEVKELQRLSNEHAPNRRMPTHPLHLMALIQQDHPLIYNPLWTRTFLPLLCPSSLAPNYLGRHLCYFQNLQRNNPNHAQLRPDNDQFSKKLAFCLGYSLQAFWIMAKRPFPACVGGAPPPPAPPQRAATGKQQHHPNPNPNPKNHFCWQRQNLEFLAKYFGMLCLQLWTIRSCVKDRHDHHAGVWQADECVQSHIRSITSSTTPAPSSSSSSATAPARRRQSYANACQ